MAKKQTETSIAYDYQAGKDERLKAILEKAGAAIDAEKVEYFLGVVHLQPENEDGGKVHVQHELKPSTFLYLLDAAEPTREDLVRIGMWVGQRLNATK